MKQTVKHGSGGKRGDIPFPATRSESRDAGTGKSPASIFQRRMFDTIRHSSHSAAHDGFDARLNDSPRMAAQRVQMGAIAGTPSHVQAAGRPGHAVQAKSASSIAAQSRIVQRKIGDATNVVFGLSGRDEDAVKSAVEAGYTVFDGADSYGSTITYLETAIKKAIEGGKKRGDFEIIYKVDTTPAKDLEAHLRTVAGKFGGYLDQVLIHKVTDVEQAKKYDPILAALKEAGVIKKVGAGDVKAGMDAHFEGKDSFEIDANDLFLSPDAETLIEKLNTAAKPVFVYNIVGTLKNILGMDEKTQPSQSQLSGMVNKIRGLVGTAEPILSSKTAEKAAANLKIYEAEDDMEAFETYGAIDEGIKAKKDGIPVAEMKGSVKARVKSILFGGYDWGAEHLFKVEEGQEAEREKMYEKARTEKLALFNAEELAVRYRGESKTLTLAQLVNMLFDSHGNCHRVEASNFLAPIMLD